MSLDLAAFTIGSDGVVVAGLADATVSGPPRLLQRVAVELSTELDSVPYLTGRGTPFLAYLRNRAATETDVFAAFAASHATLQKNLQSEETDADPDTERFASAKAGRIIVDSGHVSLRIVVVNKANLAQQLVLPLNLTL